MRYTTPHSEAHAGIVSGSIEQIPLFNFDVFTTQLKRMMHAFYLLKPVWCWSKQYE